MRKSLRRVCTLALAFTMALSFLPPLQAAEYADVTNHWARAAIERWSDLGILKGNDGLFRPDDPVTRCELAAILNRMLKYPDWPFNTFDDLPSTHWAYRDLLALARQDVLHLEDANLVRPEEPLSRQEAAYMIYSAFRPNSQASNPQLTFKDTDQIAEWARGTAKTMKAFGFISGTPEGYYEPGRMISRAEVVKILDNMVDTMIDKPGVYAEPLGKNVLVSAPNVTLLEPVGAQLKNLFISPGIGRGTVIADMSTMEPSPSVKNAWLTHMVCYSGEQLVVTTSAARNISEQARGYRTLIPTGDERFAGGYGTESDPYLISTQAQLELIREKIPYDSHKLSAYTIYYRLINDITLEGQWVPFGAEQSMYHYFTGHLDGDGHTIRGMRVEADNLQQNGRAGLFCGLAGSVKNLTIEGSIIVTISPDIKYIFHRTYYVGGLAASLGDADPFATTSAGLIENCTANVTITFDNRNATGTNEISVGGLVGITKPSSQIVNCSATGDVTAQQGIASEQEQPPSTRAGGLVGLSSGAVTDSHASGDVLATGGNLSFAGGLTGIITSGRISRCYATGKVHAEGGDFQNNAGGFSGQVHYGMIESCWASGDVSIGKNEGTINVAGGFASGIYDNSIIQNCFATGSVTEYGFWGLPMVGSFTGRSEGSVVNCYATGNTAVIDSIGASHPYNTIVGSRRSTGGIITHCADLTDNETGAPFFIDEPNGGKAVSETRTAAQMKQQTTYTGQGWDFQTVWKMPGGTVYSLPILRGVGEELQIALPMPSHLK